MVSWRVIVVGLVIATSDALDCAAATALLAESRTFDAFDPACSTATDAEL
jgi:hypothetical protein